MRFLVVSVGRNPGKRLRPCLESIRRQSALNIEVCAVDDSSTDGSDIILKEYVDLPGWNVILNTERRWAMANQHTAWMSLEPEDDDVVCFVDLDDALAHRRVFEVLQSYYDAGAWMTYGSYLAVPTTHPSVKTCAPAKPYPHHVVAMNMFRSFHWWFNHMRTVSWKVLKHLTTEDLQDSQGNYWRAIMDPAVMIPCLELSGSHTAFVPEVLYHYTCDGADAVWRTMRPELQRESQELRARGPKAPL